MKKPILLLVLAGLCVSFQSAGQKIKLVEGDVGALKGQSAYNFEFGFDGLKVGKFDNEKDYIAKKKSEYNEKEQGKGDQWEKSWYDDRKNRFEPRFIESFTAAGFTSKEDAPYTIIFNTTFIEPGFNVGVMRKNAYIDAIALVVSTADKSKVVAKFTIDDAPGRLAFGYDFDTGTRIQESYATSGKDLGRWIAKKAGK